MKRVNEQLLTNRVHPKGHPGKCPQGKAPTKMKKRVTLSKSQSKKGFTVFLKSGFRSRPCFFSSRRIAATLKSLRKRLKLPHFCMCMQAPKEPKNTVTSNLCFEEDGEVVIFQFCSNFSLPYIIILLKSG